MGHPALAGQLTAPDTTKIALKQGTPSRRAHRSVTTSIAQTTLADCERGLAPSQEQCGVNRLRRAAEPLSKE